MIAAIATAAATAQAEPNDDGDDGVVAAVGPEPIAVKQHLPRPPETAVATATASQLDGSQAKLDLPVDLGGRHLLPTERLAPRHVSESPGLHVNREPPVARAPSSHVLLDQSSRVLLGRSAPSSHVLPGQSAPSVVPAQPVATNAQPE